MAPASEAKDLNLSAERRITRNRARSLRAAGTAVSMSSTRTNPKDNHGDFKRMGTLDREYEYQQNLEHEFQLGNFTPRPRRLKKRPVLAVLDVERLSNRTASTVCRRDIEDPVSFEEDVTWRNVSHTGNPNDCQRTHGSSSDRQSYSSIPRPSFSPLSSPSEPIICWNTPAFEGASSLLTCESQQQILITQTLRIRWKKTERNLQVHLTTMPHRWTAPQNHRNPVRPQQYLNFKHLAQIHPLLTTQRYITSEMSTRTLH